MRAECCDPVGKVNGPNLTSGLRNCIAGEQPRSRGAASKAPGTQALVKAYQDHLDHTAQTIPVKRDFNPLTLGRWVSFCAFLDVRDPEAVVYRLVGETLKERFGFDPTGRSYLEFVPDFRKPIALRAFEECASWPCAMAVMTEQTFGPAARHSARLSGCPSIVPTRASYLLFIDQPFDMDRYWAMRASKMRYSNLLDRYFIDLGFGTPSDFIDMIPAPDA